VRPIPKIVLLLLVNGVPVGISVIISDLTALTACPF
jgi:hypothetical protein